MEPNYQTLAQITDVKFRAEMAKLQRLKDEEMRLRRLLDSLSETSAKRLTLAEPDQQIQQALGADALWEVWVGKRRMVLQAQMANLMVKKAKVAATARIAFGRARVAEQLLEGEATKSNIQMAARRETQQYQMMVFNAGR